MSFEFRRLPSPVRVRDAVGWGRDFRGWVILMFVTTPKEWSNQHPVGAAAKGNTGGIFNCVRRETGGDSGPEQPAVGRRIGTGGRDG